MTVNHNTVVTIFPEGPVASPGFLLWRVTLRWQRSVTEALKPLELTHVQFVVLACVWWLSQGGRRPNQITVAQQADTNVSMTSDILRKLQLRELVTIEVDPVDRRSRSVVVTDQGRALAERAVRVVEQVDVAFFERTPDSMVAALQTLAEVPPEPSR